MVRVPGCVRAVLDAVFASLGWDDWLHNPPAVASPGVELLPDGYLLVFDYVDDEDRCRTFLSALVFELERSGWSGELLPPPRVRLGCGCRSRCRTSRKSA